MEGEISSLSEATLTQWSPVARQSLSLPLHFGSDEVSATTPTSSTSCSENNSLTDLNQHLPEKPPLVKTVDLTKEESDNSNDFFVERKISECFLLSEHVPNRRIPSTSILSEDGSCIKKTSKNREFVNEALGMQFHLPENHSTMNNLHCLPPCDSNTTSPSNSVTLKNLSQLRSLSEGSLDQEITAQMITRNDDWSPPPPPERYDSLESTTSEEKGLHEAAWFQAGIPREIVLEIIANEPVGSFLVRKSTSKPGCYALSLRVPLTFQPTGVAHYLILKTIRGYKIKGFTKEFSTLSALITHHSVMPELLPCPLRISRHSNIWRRFNCHEELVDLDQDPTFNLTDFRRTLADLNV
ncbi:uncharacterized protein LOC143252436 isoform X2 [Tachypleus tridentatus]